MATEADVRKIEKAFSQPATWKMTGTLGALLATLPKIGGQSPVRVISGKEEEMMNKLGYDTAWTDFNTITFTSKFLSKLTEVGVAFVMLHELGHIAFKHKSRCRGRQPMLWNIAGDIKINDSLLRFVIPNFLKSNKDFHAGVLFENNKPLGIGFTAETKDWLDKFREFTEEESYYLLEEEYRAQRKQEPQNGKGSCGGGGSGGGSGGCGGFDFDQAGHDAFDDHIDSSLDLRKKLEDEFGEEGKKLADKMDLAADEKQQDAKDLAATKAVSGAMQASKRSNRNSQQAGSHIDNFIESAIEIDRSAKSKYQWKFVISSAMQDANIGPYMEDVDLADELSEWSRIPELREQMGTGEVFRADLVRRSCTANLLHVQDTSGSMSEDDIKYSLIEEKEICTNNRVNLTFVSADTVGRDRIVFTPDDLMEFPTSLPIKGGGGTDMLTPVVEEICANEKPYDMILVFTDGYFEFYDYKTLVEAVKARDPLKVANIPPLGFVITTDYYDNPALNAAAATFPAGKCNIFGLKDPEVKYNQKGIEVNNGSINLG